MEGSERSRLRDGCEGLTCARVKRKDKIHPEMKEEMGERKGKYEKMAEEEMEERHGRRRQ